MKATLAKWQDGSRVVGEDHSMWALVGMSVDEKCFLIEEKVFGLAGRFQFTDSQDLSKGEIIRSKEGERVGWMVVRRRDGSSFLFWEVDKDELKKVIQEESGENHESASG